MNPSGTASLSRPELRATYRLQFHRDFTFADAQALVPYLAKLGVSHIYASPITTAVPGSTHGYDVADPTRINPELGGEEGFEKLTDALREHGMGVILDIVPNHMAASTQNPFWLEMLEQGPDSEAARIFDVDWRAGRLLLPVLGQSLQATLAAGELSLGVDDGTQRIVVDYYGTILPLRRETVSELLEKAGLDRNASVATLTSEERGKLDAALEQANVSDIVENQHWRLAWWRVAAHDLNYRRFFNITDLAGVRIEDPNVFDLVHRLPLDLVRRGLVHGLRIDHIDGLVDPAGYCQQLRAAVGEGVPILIEKILEPGEVLRDWPIEGTSGYERLNDINGLFVAKEGYDTLETDLRTRGLIAGTPAARLAESKRAILLGSLGTEVEQLSLLARDGLDAEIQHDDLTEKAIRDGVLALLVHCPVYRSYATDEGHAPEDELIWETIRKRMEAMEDPLTCAAGTLLLERLATPRIKSDHQFRRRFQQLSGPAMAKGFEDTELYRYPVLLSVNEVGGSFEHPARARSDIHELSRQRAVAGVRDLIPLATHDTKRGPLTRARLSAMSAAPERWISLIEESGNDCESLSRNEAGIVMPDALDRHLILQTLVSAWPISAERIRGYLTKALREAKRHTNWETPNETYEQAALDFAAAIVEAPEAATLRERLRQFVATLEPATRIVGLAQLVLQHTLPGTPDIYQGTELRDFSLVDPDNRRPVDYATRIAQLDGEGSLERNDAEYFKLTHALLQLRKKNPALVAGDYHPLHIAASPWRWFGFERRSGERAVRVIVPTRVPSGDLSHAAAEVELIDSFDGWKSLDGSLLQADKRRLRLPVDFPLVVAAR